MRRYGEPDTGSGWTKKHYELAFERESIPIYGNLYLPQNEDGQYLTVIIGHGFGSKLGQCRDGLSGLMIPILQNGMEKAIGGS